jgi:ABC-type polysaccharide/polyol phosphate transport system ATPase subunit
MSDIAIHAEGIGKRYEIDSSRSRSTTLREALVDSARRLGSALARRPAGRRETVWALRDVSFEVPRGHTLGIIGGNGAGKSTLLKILSRITEPTTGEARIHGRVGSLLEVGTGFHPELTGRENVYLNGAVLGMRRAEIDARFDEIIAFAEVERFVDTPVKRYSSGMYLRLAFAVAAHLDTEILIVDEVLAVGDAEFQRRCLGKMDAATRQGRTVLFVSHSMDAVLRLCSSALLLRDGRVEMAGRTADVVYRYLSRGATSPGPGVWTDLSGASRAGSGEARFVSVRYASDDEPEFLGQAHPCGPLEVDFLIDAAEALNVASLAVVLFDAGGSRVLNADIASEGEILRLRPGRNRVSLRIDALYLNPGDYRVELFMGGLIGDGFDLVESAFTLTVADATRGVEGATPQANGVVPYRIHLLPRDAPITVRDGLPE